MMTEVNNNSRTAMQLETRMDQQGRTTATGVDSLSPNILEIVRHLCEGACHTFGDVIEWCETRNDCTFAVRCPECATQFLLDEAELAELQRWTDVEGRSLVCGVRWL